MWQPNFEVPLERDFLADAAKLRSIWREGNVKLEAQHKNEGELTPKLHQDEDAEIVRRTEWLQK